MVEVDDIEAIGSASMSDVIYYQRYLYSSYDASATSRPDGEIVADPTLRST